MNHGQTIILVDPEDKGAGILAGRLRMQGYTVLEATDAAEAGRLALTEPPAAVVADLWMPKISGVQLCRLLRSEANSRFVPVILRGPEGQRNRFWAGRAGAAAYVLKGRMGDLVRALSTAIGATPACAIPNPEFVVSAGDLRDRIADHLDQALFDSVIAGEIRALGSCADFDRLFDLLSQFVSQVTSYRWMAVSTEAPKRFGLHANPLVRAEIEAEARAALGFDTEVHVTPIEDDDAYADREGPAPIVLPIELGQDVIGHVALAVRHPVHPNDAALVEVIARELAGPLRIAMLLEESRQLATTDVLTGLMNRRAFLAGIDAETARCHRHNRALSVALLDVDHFKRINDGHGHASGDAVLSAVGALLLKLARKGDLVGRWGGEEFVLAFHATGVAGAEVAAERRRVALTELDVRSAEGAQIPVSASFGVVRLLPGENAQTLIDRADRLMYQAKATGRNRVAIDTSEPVEGCSAPPSAVRAA